MATADRSEAHRAGRRGPRCKRLCASLLAALLPAFTIPPLMAQQTPASGQAATGQGVSPAGTTTPAPAAPGTNGATQGQQKQEDNGKNVLESAGGFTTLELATTTVAQLPSCLEYTIEGITLRMIIHPWGVTYFWTPHVSHYSPDLLAMSHRELQYFPYIEYRLLLAIPYYEFTRTVFSRLLATLLGFNTNVPMAGGHYLHDQFGKHQSVQFSDAMVIGHPVAMLIEAFTFKGINLPEANGGGQRPQISQADVKAWLESWVTGDTNWPPVFSEALGYKQVLMMLANSPVIQQIKQLMQQIDAALSSINGKVGDSPFCPVNSTPFEPYYLSGGDVYPWRIGYPVADSEKSLTILNPLSRDVIGPTTKRDKQAEGVIAKVLEKIMEAVRELFRERWGHIYPREGSVDQRDSAKIGAVVAQRAVDLLAEKEKPTGRIYRIPRYRMRGVAWSKMYPVETSCHKNIANTGTEVDRPYDMYAWTVWTQHDCDLFPVGIPIAFVPLGIAITPPVPD